MIARYTSSSSHRRATVLLGLATVLLATFASSVSTALAAEGPRWAATVVPTPTKLIAESPRNQIEEIAINATGGTFRVNVTIKVISSVESVPTAPLPYNATASEVEAAINAALAERSSPVHIAVSGGPGASAPYVAEWGPERVFAPEALHIDSGDSQVGHTRAA